MNPTRSSLLIVCCSWLYLGKSNILTPRMRIEMPITALWDMSTCLEHSSTLPLGDTHCALFPGSGISGQQLPKHHSCLLTPVISLPFAVCIIRLSQRLVHTITPWIAQKSPSSLLGVKLNFSAVILFWISVLADALRDAAPDQSLRHRTLLLPILLSVWAFRIPATSFRGDDSLSGFCKLWPEVRTFIQTVGVTSSMNETILCFPFSSHPIIMWAPGNTPVQMDCGLSGYLITIYTTSSDHPFTFS